MPLIWGDFANDSVRVNGVLSVGSPLGTGDGANIYSFPTIDGQAGQALTTDGNGNVSWGTGADNLGNHTATESVQMNGNWISNDGGQEGILIDASGNVGVGTGTPSNPFEVGQLTSSTYSADLTTITGASGTGLAAHLVVDNSASTFFSTFNQPTGWWQYDFGAGNEIAATQYTMTSPSFAAITSWEFQGSNDGVNWTVLHASNTAPSSEP